MDAADTAIVRRTMLFNRLTDAQFAELVGGSLPHAYPKGCLLFQQGEVVETIPIVVSGWVRLFRVHVDGVDTTVRIVGPAHGFVEAAVLLGRPTDISAETVSDARILMVDADRLRSRLTPDADVAISARASASVHLRNLVADLEKLKTLSVPRRIAHFIVDTVGRTEGPAEVRLPYEKSLIAGHIGMTAESFSRGLAKLRAHGVSTLRDVIRVERMEALLELLYEVD